MNVSSIILQVLPKNIERIVEELKQSEICDYHLHDETGKIVVTIEGEDVGEESDKFKALKGYDDIISADLVYSYSEDEIEQAISDMKIELGKVPEVLNDDVPAEKVRYNGHPKV